MQFVHLHLHTQYSLLDGAITIERLVGRIKEFGSPAVAITDHGNLFGGIEFYQQAIKNGIRPILGCEVYIQSEGSRFEKKVRKGQEPYHHLTLLAADLEGYRNLCRLITAGHLEGFYYKPRIDKEILSLNSKGIIALSGCLSGQMAEAALGGGLPAAKRLAEEFWKIFGDRFYLEVQANSLPEQQRLNEVLFELSKDLSIPAVATNDCHYLHKEDAPSHEALLCIQTGKTLQDEDRMRFSSNDFYVRSPEEMAELFQGHPETLERTLEIADRCRLELDFKTYYFPKFSPPEGKSLDQYLEEAVRTGLEERWKFVRTTIPPDQDEAEVRRRYDDRIVGELEMILKMGFSGYFLIVADFINFAKGKQIPVGPGRGSAAGSLVAFCLKITDIDPIPYNLLFERFLNPERISMPDMDIDFCMNRRDEVIRYVQEKYGNVSQIITFGKMKAKAVIRDVGRVMNMPYKEVDRIAKLVPETLNITLDEACRVEPRLKDLEAKEPQVKELLKTARALEGLTRHASTHAAGVVISDQPLVNFMPLYRGQRDEIVAQYDMKAIEKIGLIKFDFLGLKTLTVIDQALKIIRRTKGVEIRINEIGLDDAEVYKCLSSGDTVGIFQLESSGMRELIIKMKPTAFPDLIALVALYRPGPLGSGMVDDFINRKHGRLAVRYELPALEKILQETYGIIVYQEQVMQIASALANFSLGDADLLRRAMGKKKPEEMATQRDKFLAGCAVNKIPPKKAEKIFDQMAKFAEYGFNKSHSAAYAFIAYQTAYLKAHYPVEYLAALLTNEMGNTDKVMTFIQDCRDHAISVLPPDINECYAGFSVVGERMIRFGLAAVKNVGEAAIESIVEVRKRLGVSGGAAPRFEPKHPAVPVQGGRERFRSFAHFCEEIDTRRVNRRVIESLVKCGAFDSLGVARSQAFGMIDAAVDRAARIQKRKASGQAALFDANLDAEPSPPEIPEWGAREKLGNEKESLGFYITGHPIADYVELLKQRATHDTHGLRVLKEGSAEAPPDAGKLVSIGGVISAVREVITKNGDRMGFATLEDMKGTVSVILFSDLYRRIHPILKEDEPVFVRGSVDLEEDTVKLIAREVTRLREMPDRATVPSATAVHFHLPATGITRDQLESLKVLLAAHRGKTPAYIHLKQPEKGETILELPEGLKVDPSADLMREVDTLFGSPVSILQ